MTVTALGARKESDRKDARVPIAPFMRYTTWSLQAWNHTMNRKRSHRNQGIDWTLPHGLIPRFRFPVRLYWNSQLAALTSIGLVLEQRDHGSNQIRMDGFPCLPVPKRLVMRSV